MDYTLFHELLVPFLKGIGLFIKQSMTETLLIDTKTSSADLVTNVDKEIEKKFLNFIGEHFPTHRVLGEEGIADNPDSLNGYVWIIDPIDGTLNFVMEKKNFSVMIALYKDGVGYISYLLDVMEDTIYHAFLGQGAYRNNVKLASLEDKDFNQSIINISSGALYPPNEHFLKSVQGSLSVRMIGSASQSFIYMIIGAHQGYVATNLNPWDYLPGLVFAKELQIKYTTVFGEPITLLNKQAMIFATPKVHHALIQNFKKVRL